MRYGSLLALTWLLLCGCSQSPPQPAPTQPASRPSTVLSATATPASKADADIVVATDSPKYAQIRVQPVEEAQTPVAEVLAPGKVEANPNYVAHVTLSVPGRVTRVLVRLGDRVSEGQPLMTVVGPDVGAAVSALRGSQAALRQNQGASLEGMAKVRQSEATVLQAQAALSKAITARRRAAADHQRVADLYKHNAVARKELLYAESDLKQADADVDNARAGVEQARAGVAQSRASLSQAQANIDRGAADVAQAQQRLNLLGIGSGDINEPVVVHSPLSGKVLEIRVVAGEYHSDTGASVMTIADLRSVWVTSNVPESSIRLIREGDPVEILLDAYPEEVFKGRVSKMGDVLDPKTRTLRVAIELYNPHGRLRPEMYGRIQHSRTHKRLPVVPVSAVVQSEAEYFVMVEKSQGRFERRQVTIGKRHEGRFPVLKGLKAGERVVADSAILLRQ